MGKTLRTGKLACIMTGFKTKDTKDHCTYPTFWTPLVFSPDVAVVVVPCSLTSEALKTIGEWCGCNTKINLDLEQL